MNKTTKLGIVSLFLLILALLPSTLSTDESIGYEIIDEYLHIWNQGQIEPNYYYENNCLSQVSNHLDEQWETVTKYLGTEINGQCMNGELKIPVQEKTSQTFKHTQITLQQQTYI